MPNPAPLLTTLHPRHAGLGAGMAVFAGWDMPLWYRAGAIREHLAVIRSAGLFDTGHMDVVRVEGPNARNFLNYAFTRDIAGLPPERAAYGAFLDRDGHAVDDALVYPLDDDRFGVVVNASMGPAVAAHLATLPDAEKLTVAPVSPRLAKLDLQGPASAAILRKILADADRVLDDFPYFSFKGDFDPARTALRLVDGAPLLLSRSGYTGELGFELFVPTENAPKIWDDILAAGGEYSILPCGLAARDSLRVGAVLPLSHRDIGDWPFVNHPWTFALPLDKAGNFTKDFVGRERLDPASADHTLPFVGFDQRRVDGREGVALLDGEEIGRILSIVSDVAVDRLDGKVKSVASPGLPEGWTPRGLACGFVKVRRRLAAGTRIALKDGRREIRVEIVDDIRPDRSARRKLRN